MLDRVFRQHGKRVVQREVEKYVLSMWKSKKESQLVAYAIGVVSGVIGATYFYQLKKEYDEPGSELMVHGWPSKSNIKVREQYVLSYDTRTRNASWVCEHLTKAKLRKDKDVERSNANFQPDPSTHPLFQVKPIDYNNTGYDRGHLAPARDFASSQTAMNESFYMTNISPQVGTGFNRSYWSRFEGFTRHLASIYPDVYVITGPMFLPKKDKKSSKMMVTYEVIGGLSSIAVPTHFFKVILARKHDGNFVIGSFILPNKPIDSAVPLTKFESPIDVVERHSGLNFFEKISKDDALNLCKDTKCILPQIEFQQAMKRVKEEKIEYLEKK